MKAKQKYILAAAGVFALVFVSIFFNKAIYSSLKDSNPEAKGKGGPRAFDAAVSEAKTLPSENPKDFSIFAQKNSGKPPSQAQSDADMKKTLAQGKVLGYLEEEKAFENIQMAPQDYKRRLDEINERIRYYEELKRDSLRHEEAVQKLETLYRLKSTLTVLKDKIISKKPSQ